jgi:hypothetical protein
MSLRNWSLSARRCLSDRKTCVPKTNCSDNPPAKRFINIPLLAAFGGNSYSISIIGRSKHRATHESHVALAAGKALSAGERSFV